jgi:hypothetical protein
LLGVAAHRDKGRIEGAHVLGQQRPGVALGIDGDKHHLQLVAIGAQQALDFGGARSVVGHTSGHWVKPKNSITYLPLKSRSEAGLPSL